MMKKRIRWYIVENLLPQLSLVEGQLVALKNVSIHSSTLPRSAADAGVQSSGGKLRLDRALHLGGRSTGGQLPLYALALGNLLSLLSWSGLASPLLAESDTVVGLIPLSEWSSVDLDDGGFSQGVSSDEFVVGRMEGDGDNTGLLGDAFGSPGEVARIETDGAELAVTTTGADEMDTFGTDTGVGSLTSGLEGTLLAVLRAFGTGGIALVARVS